MDETSTANNALFNPNLADKAKYHARNLAGGEWLIFWFAIIIHYFDAAFSWGFNGINIIQALRTLGGGGFLKEVVFYGILINAAFWIVLLAVFLVKKPENPQEFLSDMFLVGSIFLVGTLTGLTQGIINPRNIGSLIHLLFIWFGIRNGLLLTKYDRIQSNYITIFIIFLDFFAFNFVYASFSQGFLESANAYLINRVVVPILPIISLVYIDASPWRTGAFFVLSVFYILLFMNVYGSNLQFQQLQDPANLEAAREARRTVWDKLVGIFTGFKTQWNESQRIISGDYYTGQVEQYEYESLGVFLEDIESSDEVFLENESVTVWATLKAYTLEDKEINITVNCYVKNGTKNNIPGEIKPVRDKGVFNVESYDEEFISCSFPKGFKIGIYQVFFNATFEFTTQSYLKTYYIEKERKRVLTSEGIDIFSEYGIVDRDPTTRFTNGPVKIGMGTATPPTGVPSTSNEFSAFIGITLDNNWEGKIKEMKYITLELPEGLRFNSGDCNYFTGTGNEYHVNQDIIDKDNKKEIVLPKSYKCPLSLQSQQTLLGQSPISIKYFKADTKYIYQITEKTSINVKRAS